MLSSKSDRYVAEEEFHCQADQEQCLHWPGVLHITSGSRLLLLPSCSLLYQGCFPYLFQCPEKLLYANHELFLQDKTLA